MGSSSSKPASKLSLSSKVSSQITKSTATSQSTTGQSRVTPSTSPQSSQNATQNQINHSQSQAQSQSQNRGEPNSLKGNTNQASETKSRAIIEDSTDPQLLANLAKLGQVQIQRSKQNFKPSDQMLKILKARQGFNLQSEQSQSQSQTPSNSTSSSSSRPQDLSVQTITSLLDERKNISTLQELKDLSIAYDIDDKVLDRLFRFYNSPSIDPESENDRELKLEQVRNRVNGGGDDGGNEDDMLVKVNAVWLEPRIKEGEVRKLE